MQIYRYLQRTWRRIFSLFGGTGLVFCIIQVVAHPLDTPSLSWLSFSFEEKEDEPLSHEPIKRAQSLSYASENLASSIALVPDWEVATSGLFDSPAPGLTFSDLSFADIDNDNDLDFLLSGKDSVDAPLTAIYTFSAGKYEWDSLRSASLEQLSEAKSAWGDFDNDGDIDLALVGRSATDLFGALYRNDGDTFAIVTNPIPGVHTADLDWVDYDNDGYLDLSVMGTGNSGPITQIFRNQFFSNPLEPLIEVPNALPDTWHNGAIAWSDHNKDGFPDFMLVGEDPGGNPVTKLFENAGDGILTEVTGTGITAVDNSTVEWGDYNNDGWPDILLSGYTSSNDPFLGVFRNNKNGKFTRFSLEGIGGRQAHWGDLDDDGDLDIYALGDSMGVKNVSILYTDNSGTFELDEENSTFFEDIDNGAIACADYDKDGLLDLFLVGETSTGDRLFEVYHNIFSNPTPKPRLPAIPQNLSAFQRGDTLFFTWEAPSSVQYPANLVGGLTYNIYVGIGPTQNALSSNSNISSGFRRVVRAGNVFHEIRWSLIKPPSGLYNWGVQSIDADLEGSGFVNGPTIEFEKPDWTDISYAYLGNSGVREDAVEPSWVNVDLDNDLDLFVIGSSSDPVATRLFQNFGDSLREFSSDFPALSLASSSWGDFNKDGFPDVALIGAESGNPTTRVFQNEGGGNFVEIASSFDGVQKGDIEWVDYDNDGDLDLIYLGVSTSGNISRVYRNDMAIGEGSPSFEQVVSPFPSLEGGEISLSDVDNDGDIDIFMIGMQGVLPYSGLFINQDGGNFSLSSTTFPSAVDGVGEWLDYDNDGDPDLLVTGTISGSPSTQLLRNEGATFTNVPTSFSDMAGGDIIWGDINFDGYRDVILTGVGSSGPNTEVYLNDGTGSFVLESLGSRVLPNLGTGAKMAFGDVDGNGSLDVFSSGPSGSSGRSHLIQNLYSTLLNSQPEVPIDLVGFQDGRSLTLTWAPPAGGDNAIIPGFTYAVFIGTEPDNLDVKAPLTITSSGKRLVVQEGSSFQTNSLSIEGLLSDTYYWSVQAIDQDFEGSNFATIDTVDFFIPLFLDSTTSYFSVPPTGLGDASLAWADYDNNDHLDLIISGEGTGGKITQLYRNTGTQLVPSNISVFADVSRGSLDWADYDADGFVDLLLIGEGNNGSLSVVYRNNGDQSFTPVSLLEGLFNGEGKWIDWDNDGDQDVIVSGTSEEGPKTLGYLNDGMGTFSVREIGLPDLELSSLDIGDFDKDGYADVLLAGRNSSGFAVTGLYRNQEGRGFEDAGFVLGKLSEGDVAFMDFNNDGFSDLSLTGESTSGLTTLIYLSSDGTSFSEALSLKGIKNGSMEWGDYDNDGFQDLLLMGFDGNTSSDRTVEVFMNVEGNQLVSDDGVSPVIPELSHGQAIWGDYDNDGKLDIVVSGEQATGDFFFGLFHNEEQSAPTSPAMPENLAVSQVGQEVLFTWDPPQGIAASLVDGLSYNIWVSPTSGSDNILSGNSNIANGYRKIVKSGNAFQRTSFRLKDLPEGSFTWAVQTLDTDYEGSGFATGQDFIFVKPDLAEVTIDALPDTTILSQVAVAWGDYDSDNYLDILAVGEGASGLESRLYRNLAGNSFQAVTGLDIDGVKNGFVEWGDYDNDGDLDVVVVGENLGGGSSSIYRNDGEGDFIRLPLALEQVMNGSADWGDYDNDGDLDLVIMGEKNDQSRVTRLYENLTNDNFLAINTSLPGLSEGSVEWGDMDNDDDLDLLLCGRGPTGPTTALFQNNGEGGLTELFLVVDGIQSLENIWKGNATWGDVNNDGFHDILMAGTNQEGDAFVGLYINNSNGSFSDISLSLTAPIDSGRVALGDLNDDGLRDLIFSGTLTGQNVASLALNQGGTSFVEDPINSTLLGLNGKGGFPAWADFDKDGKLDVLLTQPANSPSTSRDIFLYRNEELSQNDIPNPPTNLQFVPDNEIITLSWSPPSGTGDRSNGYTYNLYVARQLEGVEFQSPMADLATGFRRIASQGAIKGNSWQLKGFSAGNYIWRVQAIDQDLEGSAFSVENSFTFTPPDLKVNTVGVLPNNIGGISRGDLSWADVNNDDRLDLFIMGNSAQGRASRVYQQNTNGFALAPSSIEGLTDGEAAWGDFNNDGLVDLGLVGESDTGFVSLLYTNQLNGLGSPLSLEGLKGGSIDFGDYDNDGLLDVLLSGENASGEARTLVYQNLREQGFSLTFELIGIKSGDAKWADINKDGWLDLALVGRLQGDIATAGRVYINQGGEDFLLSTSPLTGVDHASMAWGDYDKDGWIDLVVSGEEEGLPRTRVYKNLGNSQFSSVALLDGVYEGEVGWGDFNDDGFPDIALTGSSSTGGLSSLFRNLGGISFERDSLNSVSLINVGKGSSLAWGDYDRDGKIDLVIGGESDTATLELALFKNFENTSNKTPLAPQNLIATAKGEKLHFSWSPDPTLDPQEVMGLTYNLYLGTVPGAINKRSPMAKISDGYRRVVKFGALQDTSWTIYGLETGTYYWSVQSIDCDYEGSSFAPEQSIQFTLPSFRRIITDSPLKDSLLAGANPALAWGDYDNDNDLDLLFSGQVDGTAETFLYENLGLNGGNLNFSKRTFPLIQVHSGAHAWADYNGDGFMDFILTGESPQGLITRVYRNDSTEGFTDIQANIPGVKGGVVSWGDLDNDGDLDLLLCGERDNSQPYTGIFLNQGGDDFSFVNLGLPAIHSGTVQWVDIDSDGLRDIFLSGEGTSGPQTAIYRNVGNKKIELFSETLLDLSHSNADWGDINNDGFPDLVHIGVDSANNKVGRVYQNNNGQGFTLLTRIVGVEAGDLELNDFDEDGFQDILLVGQSDTLPNSSFLYYNELGLSFQLDTTNSLILPSLAQGGRVAWADIDNDGKTDFALAGTLQGDPDSSFLDFFINVREGTPDNIPLAPGQISLQPPVKGPDRVTLSWGTPGTPSKASGYTYNIFVGTEKGKDDVLSAQADLSSGKLKFVGPGNMGHATSIELRNLPAGTYYWGVQSVDQEYEASPFQIPVPDSFSFTPARFIEVTDNVLPFEILGFTEGDMDMGDFNNDNNLDILYSGATDSGFVTKVFINIGQSRYEDSGIELPGLTESAVAWGDFNNDGYLDAVIAGFDGINSRTLLYENREGENGERTLEIVPDQVAKFFDMRNGSLDWGDYDNDGYLDLLLVGQTSIIGQTTAVYWNRRGINGKYFESPVLLAGLANSSAKWGDVDNDGDVDILANGSAGVISTKVFLNDCENCPGNDQNRFLRELDSLKFKMLQLHNGSVDWGDWDNDGDLDVLITGEDVNDDVFTRVYSNLGEVNGQIQFSDAGFNLPGIADGEAHWADYNEDGFLDIILSGRNGLGENDRLTALLAYDPAFQAYIPDDLANSILVDGNQGVSLAWADYDGDGLLDLFTSGREDGIDTTRTFRVFQNKTGESTPPLAPGELVVTESRQSSPTTFDLDLRWTPPGNSGDTVGYSYNLVFNRISPSGLLISPLSDTLTGTRRVVRMGNAGQASGWTIKGIPEGIYSWRVQSVDQSMEGSEFSLPTQVILEIPSFEDVTPTIFESLPTPLADGDLIVGDVDNDEDLDLFVTGVSGNGITQAQLYVYSKTQGDKYILSPFSENIDGIINGQAAWGDYDLDGDIDLLVSGENPARVPSTTIYENIGEGNFVADTVASSGLPQVMNSSVAWGDFNRDGFPDILITGNTGEGKIAALYENNGNKGFELFRAFGGVDRGSVAFGDYNKDSNLDLIITGSDANGSPVTNVFRNSFDRGTVEYGFQNVEVNIQFRAFDSSIDWEDVNNDGYLDLLLTGTDFLDRTSGALFVYNPLSNLYEARSIPTRVSNGEVSLGDYNFDGFRDLLITGKNEEGELDVQVAPNTQGQDIQFGQDIRSTSKLIQVERSSSKWGEIGRPDGKLDIFLAGRNEQEEPVLRVYQNVRAGSPADPPRVTNLQGSDRPLFVELDWDLPQEIDSSLVGGLTYNLLLERVVTLDSSTLRVNPLSEVSTENNQAIRRVIGLGNLGHENATILTQIPTGTYRWGIQVIGANHEGGPFVFADTTFNFSAPVPGAPIAQFAPPYFDWGQDPVEAWVEVAPSDLSRIQEVQVKYKPISRQGDNFQSIVLDRTNNRYTFEISDGVGLRDIDPSGRMIGLEYYFDVIGRFAADEIRTPTFYTYIRFPDGASPTNFTTNGFLTAGSQQQSYQMFTIPLQLSNPQISSVLDELGPYDDTQWRLFSTENNGYVEFQEEGGTFNEFEIGKAFWIIIRNSAGVFAGPGEGTTVTVTEEDPFLLTLQQGWNQIGNPYNFIVSWQDVLDHNRETYADIEQRLDPLAVFQDRQLLISNEANIGRFRGALLFSHTEGLELEIPIWKDNGIQQRRSSSSLGVAQKPNPIHFANWRLHMSITSERGEKVETQLGMDRNASLSRDSLDRMRAPRFDAEDVPFFDLTFEHPEYFYPYFSSDIVPTAEEYIWSFYVESNAPTPEITLKWDNSHFGSSGRKLFLYEVETERLVDMTQASRMVSNTGRARRNFQVIYGDPAFVQAALSPSAITLGQAYPNPFQTGVNIPFTLAADQGGQGLSVDLRVYNMLGQEIAVLLQEELPSGFHEASWDGHDQQGNAVAPGAYFYVLKVFAEGKSFQASGKFQRE